MNNPGVEQALARPVVFETSPDQYRHWKLTFDGPIATLSMDVAEDARPRPDYRLKLNSYDLGVDIELADALQRIRFEHPEVHAVVITQPEGAHLLRRRQHLHAARLDPRVQGELLQVHQRDAARDRGRERALRASSSSRALNGICAGGGYELALACDEILLVDDGNSAVSLPETPLLGVLPGTGGLTRVVDKRKVRRDLADVFSTLAEGVKGKRAVEWRPRRCGVPDQPVQGAVAKRAPRAGGAVRPARRRARASRSTRWPRRSPTTRSRTRHVSRRASTASGASRDLTVAAPEGAAADHARRDSSRPATSSGRCARSASSTMRCCGCGSTSRRSARSSSGRRAIRRRCSRSTARWPRIGTHWLVREIVLLMKRTLKRMDLTARSFFALIEPGSCVRRHAVRAGARGRPLLHARRPGTAEHDRAVADERGPVADEQRPDAAADALPRRARARRPSCSRETEPFDALAALRRRPRHLRARRARLGRRGAARGREPRGALARCADRAWKPTCGSPGPRRWRRRSSGG